MVDESARRRIKLALTNLDSLPAMPAIAQKLLALPLNTDEGERQLLNLIEQDPQISAKIISLANSPIMGVSRRIGAVADASMLLGLDRVKSVAIGIASMSNMAQLSPCENFKPQDLWLHSITIAIVMRTIAQAMPAATRPREDQIFLTGLLHDIGFMALHHIDDDASNELHLKLRRQPERPIQEVEMETLGITHSVIGAQLAQHWNLPPEIAHAITYHHAPSQSESEAGDILARLIHLAEKLEPNFGIAEHTGEAISDDDWLKLGIDPSESEEIINLADELAMQTAQASDTF